MVVTEMEQGLESWAVCGPLSCSSFGSRTPLHPPLLGRSQTSLGMEIDYALHAGVWSKAINAGLVGPLDLILLGCSHFSVLPEPLFLVKKRPTHMWSNHTGKMCAGVYGTPTNVRSGCYFAPA